MAGNYWEHSQHTGCTSQAPEDNPKPGKGEDGSATILGYIRMLLASMVNGAWIATATLEEGLITADEVPSEDCTEDIPL